MVLKAALIIFNDSKSRFYKDLIDFLKRNMEPAILKGGLNFNYQISNPDDIDSLKNKGINRLPAMVIDGNNYIGVEDIVEEIRRRVKESKGSVSVKSEEEVIRDYYLHEAMKNTSKDSDGKLVVKDDNNDFEDESESMKNQHQKELERRGLQGMFNTNTNAQTTILPASFADNKNTQKSVPRLDNLSNPNMKDAYESLQNIKRNSIAEDPRDNDMMAALIDRLGNDD
jgi:hypothetical protein